MLKSTDATNTALGVTTFRVGYERAEVDAYLERARAALAAWEGGATGALGSDDVVGHSFRPTQFGNGYDQDQVDDLLGRIAATLVAYENAPPPEPAVVAPSPAATPGATPAATPAGVPLRSAELLARRLGRTRLRQGYSIAGVDGFRAAARDVIAGYEGGSGTPAAFHAADVVNVRFALTRLRAGYDQDQVAALLDEIAATLRHHERPAGGAE